ncbi:uncharacterized protein LOC131151185 [Malania oleifera]|uniref:uncharacterized protein LOC131151185 n=1 Tax=Malania oleifera TaxID=397392 RepID=UPI0025AE8C07|nr:uncharacterized protein LOC131151185 [Malania oleifera]
MPPRARRLKQFDKKCYEEQRNTYSSTRNATGSSLAQIAQQECYGEQLGNKCYEEQLGSNSLARNATKNSSIEHSDGSHNTAEKNPEGEALAVGDNKPPRAISVSMSTQADPGSLEMAKEGVDGSSSRKVLEDCSSSIESETASSKASISDSEPHLNAKPDFQWPKFFRGLKKGSAKRLPTLPPVGVQNNAEKNLEGESLPVGDETPYSAISDSMPTQDSGSLHKEEKGVDGSSSPRGDLERSSSSIESETASFKASTSDSEAHSNSKADFQWPGFFRAFKKGSAKILHTLPPLNVQSTAEKNKEALLPVGDGKPCFATSVSMDSGSLNMAEEGIDGSLSPKEGLEECSGSIESETASSKITNLDSEAYSDSKSDSQCSGPFPVLKKSSAKRLQSLPHLSVHNTAEINPEGEILLVGDEESCSAISVSSPTQGFLGIAEEGIDGSLSPKEGLEECSGSIESGTASSKIMNLDSEAYSDSKSDSQCSGPFPVLKKSSAKRLQSLPHLSVHNTAEINPEGEILLVGDEESCSAISVSSPTQDSGSLGIAEEGIDGSSSPKGGLEDCSTSVESEITSSKANTSNSEAHSNPKADFQWPGFFRVLKKGSGKRLQNLPPLSVPSTAEKNSEGEVLPVGDDDEQSCPAISVSMSTKESGSLDIAEEGIDGLSSPRGVLEDCSSSVESETASSKASTSDSEAQFITKPDFHWPGFIRAFRKGSGNHFQTLPPVSVPKFPRRRKNKSMGENEEPTSAPPLDTELYRFKSSWKNFSLPELESATNDFSSENLIGEGGYAEVYKGILQDGQHVAIKRLTRGTPEEMTADFLSELGIIVHVDHPNTAKLIGYGVEGGMHLVLQLSHNGSLASLLQGSKEKLDWGIRYKISLGAAEGLLYLHEGCQRRIIHRDIKASNVLIAEDFVPQISDFGLAKWLPNQCTHLTVSKIEGTFGYLPPEFFMHGIVDEKTDVFAFGVLLLELITGRLAVDNSQQSLVMWAKPLIDKNNIRELVDPYLADAYDLEQMNCLVLTASLCISHCPTERPQMNQVVQFLRGDEGSLELAKQLQMSGLQRRYSMELFAEDFSSANYLNDVNQQTEIALGL